MSQQDCLGHSPKHNLNKTNSAPLANRKYVENFISSNVGSLSGHNLRSYETSLFIKGLKFVSTPRGINKFLIKEEMEACGRKLRRMCHFRNDERKFSYDPFRKKPKYDTQKRNAAIGVFLSCFEEATLSLDSLDYRVGYSNLTKDERDTLYSLIIRVQKFQ